MAVVEITEFFIELPRVELSSPAWAGVDDEIIVDDVDLIEIDLVEWDEDLSTNLGRCGWTDESTDSINIAVNLSEEDLFGWENRLEILIKDRNLEFHDGFCGTDISFEEGGSGNEVTHEDSLFNELKAVGQLLAMAPEQTDPRLALSVSVE